MEYYDFEGNPISREEWMRLWSAPDRKIARNHVGKYIVSTVWLGINHNFTGFGPPLIFETMVFHEDTGGQDHGCWRSADKESALERHQEAVLLAGLMDDQEKAD